jgi:hypothetical protein
MTEIQVKRKNIAIAFYGITRSLKFTVKSITDNIIMPAQDVGHVKVFCHFFLQHSINNPRTGEIGVLDIEEWRNLKADIALIEGIEQKSEDAYLSALKPFGNAWEDDGQSMRNILRQLISLKKVTKIIKENQWADLVIFLRADMEYHDVFPFSEWINGVHTNTVMIPDWQWSGGLNDRFAICGKDAYQHYGDRVDKAVTFCRTHHRPIHSERLLMYALMHSPIQLVQTSLRATRIRSNGQRAEESFVRVKIAKRIEAFLRCNLFTLGAIFRQRLTHRVSGKFP